MDRRPVLVVAAVDALLLALLLGAGCRSPQPLPGTLKATMTWDGVERVYYVHVPATPKPPVALVVALHDDRGSGPKMEHFSGFTPIADREGFFVVYPDGIDRQWNDFREVGNSAAHVNKVDNTGFLGAMVDKLLREYPIDPKRVYATGASNGGFMSNTLAARCSEKFAAIAPVIGGISVAVSESFAPVKPVSVLIIQGDEDPLVPIHGGTVARKRGEMIDTDETVRKWVAHDGCRPEPAATDVLDANPDDRTRVTRTLYAGGKDGSEVAYWRIEGGGHTWPGGGQYLPKFLIGRTSREFDGAEAIWAFFRAHPKP